MDEATDEQWLPISDLMSVLAMVFIIIAISFMIDIETVAKDYQETKEDIVIELKKEFTEEELIAWNAQIIDSTLSVKFSANKETPMVFFEKGNHIMTPHFKDVMKDFFPRFIKVLYFPQFRNHIEEIRIEGHTSSEGRTGDPFRKAYYYNLKLSQARTRNVLEYSSRYMQFNENKKGGVDSIAREREWFYDKVTANGLSSSKLIKNDHGVESKVASRRVEFRIVTDAEKSIENIINKGKSLEK